MKTIVISTQFVGGQSHIDGVFARAHGLWALEIITEIPNVRFEPSDIFPGCGRIFIECEDVDFPAWQAFYFGCDFARANIPLFYSAPSD